MQFLANIKNKILSWMVKEGRSIIDVSNRYNSQNWTEKENTVKWKYIGQQEFIYFK